MSGQLRLLACVLAASPSALASLPIYGTPVGMTSGELSVGRSAYWLPITDRGLAVANFSNASPVRWDADETFSLPAVGYSDVRAAGVLDDGTVLGRANKNVDGVWLGIRPVKWGPNASVPVEMQTLGTATNGSTFAMLISHNAEGVAVGYGNGYENGVVAGSLRPIRWGADGTAQELGSLATDGSHPDTRAERINASGTIIGTGRPTSSADFRPIKWLAGTTQAIELDTFPASASGKKTGDVFAINSLGTVVGTSTDYAVGSSLGITRAVKWEGIAMTALPTLDPQFASTAYAINEAGDVAGSTWTGGSLEHAVVWRVGASQPQQLDHLPIAAGRRESRAHSINDLGAVVGYSLFESPTGAFEHHAVVWAHGAAVLDLNSLLPLDTGWTLQEAGTIRTTGFIRGTGRYDPDGAGPASPYSRSWTMLVPSAGTYGRGDANFDTHVTFDDLLILAQHYGESNPSQDVHVGDFDLNGVVDFDDLLALAQHYEDAPAFLDTGARDSSFAADWALARSIVPEPTLIGLMGLSVRRRRR